MLIATALTGCSSNKYYKEYKQMRKLLLCLLCVGTLLSGCNSEQSDNTQEVTTDVVQEVGTTEESKESTDVSTDTEVKVDETSEPVERDDYDAKVTPEVFKSTAKDLRTEHVFDIQPYYDEKIFKVTDEMYDARLLYRDITIMGTKLGDLFDSFKDTGLIQEYYSLDFEVAPYHEVNMYLNTNAEHLKTSGDAMTGTLSAVNLTNDTISAKDCVVSGFTLNCSNGIDVWGTSSYLSDSVVDVNESTDESYLSKDCDTFYVNTLTYEDEDNSSMDCKVEFYLEKALSYLGNTVTAPDDASNSNLTLKIGGDVFDLNTLTYGYVVMNSEPCSSDRLGYLPTISLDSPFEYNIWNDDSPVQGVTALIDERFNGGRRCTIWAGSKNDEICDAWSSTIKALETETDVVGAITLKHEESEILINGITLTGTEEEVLAATQEYGNSTEAEVVVDVDDDEQHVELDTDDFWMDMYLKYPASNQYMPDSVCIHVR